MSEGAGTSVYVIPPPTANGPLHVGHLSGPFLAADLAARAARERGERVLALGGIDVHQNYVLTRAENDGADPQAMIATFRGEIAAAYEHGKLHEDTAVDPQDAEHRRAVAGLVAELVERGDLPMRDVTLHACADCGRTLHHSYVAGTCATCAAPASGGSCEGCGGFTSAQTLLVPACDRCGGAAREFGARVPMLSLEAHRAELTDYWLSATLPPRVRELIAHQLRGSLPEMPVAYPTNWGVEGVGALAGLRLDVYIEVGVSTFHAVARSLDPRVCDLASEQAAWAGVDSLWHFNGIDNAFYVAFVWPVLYQMLGARVDQLPGAIINEFYTLDGAKFSTSRNHAIWADEFLAKQDPELVRLFLAWDRPDTFSSDFTMAKFDAFCGWAQPLLDGADGSAAALPAELLAAEIERGTHALRPHYFDAAQAARSLLLALSGGASGAETAALRRVFAGIEG